MEFSSGLTVRTTQTLGASVQVLYRSGHQGAITNYSYTADCDTESTAVEIFAGAGILHRVFIASATATGAIATLYDSIEGGSAVGNRIARVRGNASINTQYDISVSSGLTYETIDNGCWTFVWKRGR